MKYQNVIFETENSIGVLTINRPEKMNALNKETMAEISQVVTRVKANDDIRALIITGG